MLARLLSGRGLYVAAAAVTVALALWVRWMVLEPYWLQLFTRAG